MAEQSNGVRTLLFNTENVFVVNVAVSCKKFVKTPADLVVFFLYVAACIKLGAEPFAPVVVIVFTV